jgi:antirestriction protein ArdC
MKKTTPDLADLYQQVTDRIIAALEHHHKPWTRTWHTSGPHLPLRHCGTPYRGINTVLLFMAAMAKGYRAPFWMTYRQAQALGGQVRRGETASTVTYSDSFETLEDNGQGVAELKRIWFLKEYKVFNAEQVDGLPARFYAAAQPKPHLERIAHAEAFFAHLSADIRHSGDTPFYAQRLDFIQMPPFESFIDAEAYYATLAHEAVHWTGHPSRLDRGLATKRFEEHELAAEELTAEMGAAFLCAALGIDSDLRHDHVSYLAHWLRLLQADKRAVFTAAALAQKAVDFLHGLQPAENGPAM